MNRNGNNIHNSEVTPKKTGGKSLAEAKKRQRRRKAENKLFGFCAVVVALLIVGWLLFDKLFIIEKFRIDGSSEYTAEQAEEIAGRVGLEKGMHLFGFDRADVADRAKYYIPEFDSVKIGYDLPDGIVLKVKEALPAMYIYDGGRYYVLSEGLKVIAAESNAEEIEKLALKRVYLGGIENCRTGSFIETDADNEKALYELVKVLKEEGVYSGADEINVENKFSVSFLYEKRFTVKLGSGDNFTVKIRFMKSIAEKLGENESGIIDVSDENFREGVFKPYN